MTNQEAIDILSDIMCDCSNCSCVDTGTACSRAQAFERAIQALQK